MEHAYFEQTHGKSESDQMGATGKGAYKRGVSTVGWDKTPTEMEEVAALIQCNLPCNGKSDFVEVMVVPPLVRPSKQEEGQILVHGIQKLHRITRTPDGRIIGSPLSCNDCILMAVICKKCSVLKLLFTPEQVDEGSGDGDLEDDRDVEVRQEDLEDQEDDGKFTDGENEDSEEEGDDGQGFPPGSIVWAR